MHFYFEMNNEKMQFEFINSRFNLANLNEEMANELNEKRKRCHDEHDYFKIELSKPISSELVSINLKSVFKLPKKIKNNSNSFKSQRLFDTEMDSFKMLRLNLSKRNLVKKENLLYYIENNFLNGIKCPFDLIAYTRLSKLPHVIFDEKNLYNCSKVEQISKVFSNHQNNPLDVKFLQNNSLLKCTAGSFLMPFYLDIFRISELMEFTPIEIDMVLEMKKKYAAHVHLNYNSLSSNYKENMLWNCLVIYKYKLDDFKKFKSNKFEFINYLLAMMFNLYHLEYVVKDLQRKLPLKNQILRIYLIKALELRHMIPILFEAYILTGLFTHNDYVHFERFVTIKANLIFGTSEYNIEKAYYEHSLKMIKKTCEKIFPLKLSDLSRIVIRNSIIDYNKKNVYKLTCTNQIKKFILYQNKLKYCFDEYNYVNF